MKYIFYLSSILCLLPFYGFSQNELIVDAPISSSTVYFNGAQVLRKGSFSLKNEKTTLIFKGLSPNLKEKSIRVKEDGSFMVLKVQSKFDHLNEVEKTKEAEALTVKLEEARDKIALEKTHISILKDQLEFLKTNKNIKGTDATISPADYQSLSKIYFNEISKTKLDLLTREKNRDKLQSELTRLIDQYNDLYKQTYTPSYEVSVEVEGKIGKNSKIELSYLVENSAWVPTYDIRFTDTQKPLAFTYKAEVYQWTSIDWKNIDLTLSSADTETYAGMPQLYPQYLNFVSTLPKVVAVPDEEVLEEEIEIDFFMEDSESLDEVVVYEPALDEEPDFKLASKTLINNQQTAKEYAVGAKQSFKSQKSSNTIQFFQKEFDAEYEYQCIPKLSDKVYLVALITDENVSELMNGKANVYVENSFMGQTDINTAQFLDTLEVSFGVDPSIKVQREKVNVYTAKQSVGSYIKQTFTYKISMKNTKSFPINSKVIDQIPLSSDKNIEIEVKELSEGELFGNGSVIWNIELAPNETKELTLSYTIKYPKKEKINL
ncbi:DUF4139 domain-containing protein [Sediminitomix flava]|uniref:Uncharacterized protein (TIGR02231 family) n=1 Tax=Sediminitomix flava TaxID=379075 RepID=A0A315Z995_SEDFL|nr:DUF4139 domain-containing protein [Sediminitomix flava]PWJ40116.1 uncharacterized protein (TIGR02231 family) [Sediminitomix flava]